MPAPHSLTPLCLLAKLAPTYTHVHTITSCMHRHRRTAIARGKAAEHCKSISGHKMFPHVNLLRPGTLPLEIANQRGKTHLFTRAKEYVDVDDALKIALNTFSQPAGRSQPFVSPHMTLAGCRSNSKVAPLRKQQQLHTAPGSTGARKPHRDTPNLSHSSYLTNASCSSKLISILECSYGFVVSFVSVRVTPYNQYTNPNREIQMI